MMKILPRNYYKAFLFLLGIAFLGGTILSLNKPLLLSTNYSAEAAVKKYAAEVIKRCAATGYRPSCYEKEIPKLLDFISLGDAFKVSDLVQKADSSYGYCHVLGHNLSTRETAKNPDKWMEIIRSCPQGICSNGCLHGAAQERFRNEVLTDPQIEGVKSQLSDVCEPTASWRPSGLEKSECYHGLGHLAMYITGADIKKAIGVCDSITKGGNKINFRNLCYEGLFMQLFQPLENEDFALVKGLSPSQEGLRAFCESFGEEAKIEACWQEGWPLYRNEVATSKGALEYCSQSINSYAKNHCLFILFYVKAQSTNYDSPELSSFCANLPNDLIGKCFGHMANAIIHGGVKNIDKAVNFCSSANIYGVDKECFQLLADFASYNISPASKEFAELCKTLPKPFSKDCLRSNIKLDI